MRFDVELLGDCDVIISELCQRLGGDWNTLLDGRPEIPCLEKRPVTVEEQGAFAVENPKVKSDELARYGMILCMKTTDLWNGPELPSHCPAHFR